MLLTDGDAEIQNPARKQNDVEMRSSIGNIFLGTNIRFVRLIFSVSIKLEFANVVQDSSETKNGNSLIKQEYSTLDRYRKSIQNSPTTMFLCKTATVATALLLTVLRLEMNCVNALSMPTSSTASRRDVLAHATEVVAGATASSILACGAPLTAHAAEGYRDGPEGLKYLVTNEGSGPKPVRGQKIETSYTLWINERSTLNIQYFNIIIRVITNYNTRFLHRQTHQAVFLY